MKTMYNILAFIILLAIVGLFMYFLISVENFDNDVRTDKVVNENLLSHSVVIQDNGSSEYDSILKILNKDSLRNSIKYTEGMTWGKWVDNDKNMLTKISEQVKKHIEESGIDMDVIFCQLNRYKKCYSDSDTIFLDYDIVLYNKSKRHAEYANHAKMLCVFTTKKGIDIVHFKIVGKISEDQIYMKNDADVFDKEYSSYKQQQKYDGDFIDSDDTRDSIQSHDEQVKKLLYNKLVGEPSDEEDADYIKNKEQERAHKMVRNMFLNGLKTPSTTVSASSATDDSVYKKYPYKNDFVVVV